MSNKKTSCECGSCKCNIVSKILSVVSVLLVISTVGLVFFYFNSSLTYYSRVNEGLGVYCSDEFRDEITSNNDRKIDGRDGVAGDQVLNERDFICQSNSDAETIYKEALLKYSETR
jgi:hypothetical protein